MDADEALSHLGKWSKWQLIMYTLVNLSLGLPAGWHMLAIVFIGMEPEFHCKVPDGLALNQSIPPESVNSTQLSSCKVYKNFSAETGETEKCPFGYTFKGDLYTIANEWELVCDRSYLISTSQTILVVGVMIGAMFMAMLADKIGRKPVFLGCVLAISFIGFITAWVNTYAGFAVLRFLTGICQQGIVLAGFVLTCELFPASERTVAGLVMQCYWAAGMFIMALLAYLIPNWRHYQVALSVPGILVLPLFWIIPESIPWLVAKGRIKEAKLILKNAAKFNKIELPAKFQLSEEDEQTLLDEKEKKKSIKEYFESFRGKDKMDNNPDSEKTESQAEYTIIDVVKSKKLVMFALVMCYIWCTNALVYYGLSLSTGSIAGDPYLNFFYSGLVEIPAYLICAALLTYVGRRWPVCICHIIAGIPLFLTLFIPEKTSSGTDLSGLIIALSMIGKFGITATFGSVFLYAPELFPTTVRNVGIGIASVGARIGNLASPYAPLLAAHVSWLPNTIFGVMALLAGLLTLLLPETLNRALPQTIEQVEKWTRTLSKEEKERAKNLRDAKKLQAADAKEMKDMSKRENGGAAETEPLHDGSGLA